MKSCIFVLCFAAVVYAAPRPNHGKVISVEDNEIPIKRIKGPTGASAEWGGLRATAGLGGSENGGALFAGAEVPGAGAGAGLYGGSNGAAAGAGSSSNGVGGGVHYEKDGFFDRIFAIPINVLHSVNSYVKTKQNAPPQGSGSYGGAGAGAGAGAGGNAGAGAGASAGYGSGLGTGANVGNSDAGLNFSSGPNAPNAAAGGDTSVRFAGNEASSGPAASHGHRKPVGGKPDYDRIFNIPISALKSVNDFLNG